MRTIPNGIAIMDASNGNVLVRAVPKKYEELGAEDIFEAMCADYDLSENDCTWQQGEITLL